MAIYLIGYMFSGKSTVGRRLAQRLGYAFADLDELFEERYHISIAQFFRRYDETAFRLIEHRLLLETAERDNLVVACGGGTPCFHNNMQFIKEQGTSIYLQLSVEEITARYNASSRKQQRPLLGNLPPEERHSHIANQLNRRLPYYNQADIVVNSYNDSPDTLVETILVRLKQHKATQQ